MPNMTITADEEVLRWARVKAAESNTSVAQLVGDLTQHFVAGCVAGFSGSQAFQVLVAQGPEHDDVARHLPAGYLAAIEAQSERLTTPCGDGEMVWHRWGAGPTVALFHGGFGSWTHWIPHVDAVSRHYTVPAAALPGGRQGAAVVVRFRADGRAGGHPAPRLHDMRPVQDGQGVQHARAAQAHRPATADDLQVQFVALDAHALDRAFGGAHAAADVAALQGRTGGAGGRSGAQGVWRGPGGG